MLEINTYSELKSFLHGFREKNINLLVIISSAGLGKSFIVEDTLIEQAPLTFAGHVTPLKMYIELKKRNTEEKDFIVVFDDVDVLMLNKINVALLKQICDTKAERLVKYFTTSPILKDTEPEFETECKVVMLMNKLPKQIEDENLKALLSRAHLIHFKPTFEEVIKYLEYFAEDKEILKIFKKFIRFCKRLDLRTYVKAVELKKSKLDWRKYMLTEMGVEKKLIEVENLVKEFETDKERISHYSGSRSDFYRKKLVVSKYLTS